MRHSGLMFGLVAAVLTAGAATAQQAPPFDPVQSEIWAERAAGAALMQAGEQYFNAGVSGPDSKSCRLITSAILHLTNSAAAAKEDMPMAARNLKLRERACRAS